MNIITKGNVLIKRNSKQLDSKTGIFSVVQYLDFQKGMFLSSGTEYPGRYSRWESGFYAPPVEILAYFDKVIFKPLNKRGVVIVEIFEKILKNALESNIKLEHNNNELIVNIIFSKKVFKEEFRSKQPSVLLPIRILLEALSHSENDSLGFWGAFGFDLLFQFEKIKLLNKRDENQPVIRLFFPDRIFTFDRKKETAYLNEYDITYENLSTENLEYDYVTAVSSKDDDIFQNNEIKSNMSDDEYALMVEKAKEKMKIGEIFELVLRRKYYTKYTGCVSKLFNKMVKINPSPYQFLCQFKDESLIGTSPEMFVRVTGKKVESCPISGTIKRGINPIEDEKQIKKLLNSQKDETELTMCTDVDRNDKSRICKPGSVRLLARRQIEQYKGLFHTVDHVEGILRDDCDGIDAFLSHMWAVTLMGSPKSTAVRLIEEYENEPRDYYGGAVGILFLNGNINTGITIRTVHLKNNRANYSTGASLVYDSVGVDEAKETKIKAASFFNIFSKEENILKKEEQQQGTGLKIIVIDNEDSFVNTLSDYFRQTGADVATYRHGVDFEDIIAEKPDLIVHSPGPKLPQDFGIPELVRKIEKTGIAQFGVCLGLQGIVEAFGGKLKKIDIPRQGKQWTISHNSENIFKGLPPLNKAGAYHSWVADENYFPECLKITAKNESGLIMGICHKEKPIWAVQFHPESIMSTDNDFGFKLIQNVIKYTKESKIK